MVDKIFSVFPEISTERLKLREIKQEDAKSNLLFFYNK